MLKISTQLKSLDTKIETQLKEGLDYISKLKDSDKSNNRIIRNKEKIISVSDRKIEILNINKLKQISKLG